MSVAILAQAISDTVPHLSYCIEDTAMTAMAAETFTFYPDIQQLLEEINTTSYSNKDHKVFLRELISNASEALDKLTGPEESVASIVMGQQDFFIKITPDKTNSTLTIDDSGVGMTKKELMKQLSITAKMSLVKTRALMQFLDAGGVTAGWRSGVGFYSAYLVANKVQVVSKHNDDIQYIWECSAADGYFTVQEDTEQMHGEVTRGTKVILHLKDDQSEFLEVHRLKHLLHTYKWRDVVYGGEQYNLYVDE